MLKNVLFNVVIGRPTLEQLGDVLVFKAEEVRLDYRGEEVTLSMVSEYRQPGF